MGVSPIRAGLLGCEKNWMSDYNKTEIVASKIDRLPKADAFKGRSTPNSARLIMLEL